jgi:predicted RNA-binding Zn-ribbon protein involved in translation (DUF1610 family)
MQHKTFESNPLTGRLIALSFLCVVGYATGVWIIIFLESLSTGAAVIVATSIGEAILIADAVSNLSCPECGDRLHRDRKAPKHAERYVCLHCDITWQMPPKEKSQDPKPQTPNPSA